jgi:signal transduction histidine kinase
MIGEAAAPPVQDELLAQVRRMNDALSRNLTRTRATGGRGRRAPVQPIVDDLLFALSRLLEGRQLTGENLVPETAVFFGNGRDLEEMLGNLLENAAKWASSNISITANYFGQNLVVEVTDDGPGVPVEQLEEVIGRGRRLDETMPGQGMGLSIVAEIVELYEGSFRLELAENGGLCAQLTLPGTV